MAQVELIAEPRSVTGKKVRFLRRKGIIPANIFGHNVSSRAIQVDARVLQKAMSSAGTNTLISIKVATEAEPRMVLARRAQRDATSDAVLHVDFYQVAMTEKIRLSVPLVFEGEAPGVAEQGGVLLHNIDAVEIACLPKDLVQRIMVDVYELKAIGDALHVRDLKASPGVEVLTEPEELVAKVLPPEKEEVEEAVEVAPAEAEVAPTGKEAKAEGEA
ncbi:MAG: 50S ribosomal protein L25 [Chloroflexi bacterium]|nr:50S ribosomal protein L25 [Chloroflexota bacterium]